MHIRALLVSGLVTLACAQPALAAGKGGPAAKTAAQPFDAKRHEAARERIAAHLSSGAHTAKMTPEARHQRFEHLTGDLYLNSFEIKQKDTHLPTSRIRLDAALLIEAHAHRENNPNVHVELAERFGTKLMLTRVGNQSGMHLQLHTPKGAVQGVHANHYELFGIRLVDDVHRLIGVAMDKLAPEDLD